MELEGKKSTCEQTQIVTINSQNLCFRSQIFSLTSHDSVSYLLFKGNWTEDG